MVPFFDSGGSPWLSDLLSATGRASSKRSGPFRFTRRTLMVVPLERRSEPDRSADGLLGDGQSGWVPVIRQAMTTLSMWVKTLLSLRSSGATAVTTVLDLTWTT